MGLLSEYLMPSFHVEIWLLRNIVTEFSRASILRESHVRATSSFLTWPQKSHSLLHHIIFFRNKSLKPVYIQGERTWTLFFDVRSVKELVNMFFKTPNFVFFMLLFSAIFAISFSHQIFSSVIYAFHWFDVHIYDRNTKNLQVYGSLFLFWPLLWSCWIV